MFKKYQQLHFVGIGGVGMSGIAEVLLNLGYRVTGSDQKRGEAVERLERLGAKIYAGHEPSHVEGAHVVVYSSAVARDNVEVHVARQRGVPVIPRAEMLAELMRLKYGIAIAGTHGKTTTTSMVAAVLGAAGLDPTVVVGGRVHGLGTNARLGQGEFLVAEADESDGSFLKLTPTIAVVTTIDGEHLDYYADLDTIRAAFLTFVNKVPFYGSAVLCLDQPNIQQLIPSIEKRVITYGIESGADVTARRLTFSGMQSQFEVMNRGKILGHVAYRFRVATTCSTPSPRSASASTSRCPLRESSRPSPASRASSAASRSRGRRGACSWSTTTVITPPRSVPPSPPPRPGSIAA
jgi:UDP-N-acetylmuramate--alanine ligase